MRVDGKEILGKRKIRRWLKGEESKTLSGGRILHCRCLGKRKSRTHNAADEGEQSLRDGIEREQTTPLRQNIFCCVLGRVRLLCLSGESGLSVTILVGVSKTSPLVIHN